MYKDMRVEKGRVRVNFSDVGSGLMSKGPLTGFYIAGDDKNFVPSDAKIDGNSVLVWSKDVSQPVAVRYGFQNTQMLNLYNKEGVPVNLFRTDDWPVQITRDKK
jgi:sialate O-acetylesterase